MMKAAAKGNTEIVGLLLSAKANIDAVDFVTIIFVCFILFRGLCSRLQYTCLSLSSSSFLSLTWSHLGGQICS